MYRLILIKNTINIMPLSIYNSLSKDTAAAAESLSVMLQKEKRYYSTSRLHSLDHPSSLRSSSIDDQDRTKIVQWLYFATDRLGLDRETVAIAMDMVDRFLSSESICSAVVEVYLSSRKQYQLLSLTAFYVSAKINECVTIGSESLSDVCNGIYSAEEIEATELTLLHGLSWQVCAPTSVQIACHVLSLLLPHVNVEESTWGFILDEVRLQTEIFVKYDKVTLNLPSTVALAAIFNALEQVDARV